MLRLAWITLRALTSVSESIQRRFTVAGRFVLAGAAAAAAIGMDTERSMSYQAFALAAALLSIGALFGFRFRPRLAVTRVLPRFATAGSVLAYRVRIENRAQEDESDLLVEDRLVDPRPTLARYLGAGPPPGARSFIERHSGYARWRALARQHAELAGSRPVPRMRGGEACMVECELVARARGVLRFESVAVARVDPLGLVKAPRIYAAAQRICVLPRRYQLPPLGLPGARRYQHGGVALAQSVGDSEEFVSLREYRPGDPLQRVHWKSFARVGEPIVKEFQDEFFARHCVVLDNAIDPDRHAEFEEAVSIAASFVCAIDTHDCLIDLMMIGAAPVCFTGGRGLLQTGRLLELLAGVEGCGAQSFDSIATAVLARRAELSSLILITARWDVARRDLIERVRALGVPVLAIAVVARGEATEPAVAGLHAVEVGRIEADLQRALS